MRQAIIQTPRRTTIATFPSRQDIENLKVGDTAPNCFRDAIVTRIVARREDIHGKLFCCYYTRWGTDSSEISMSLKEDELTPRINTLDAREATLAQDMARHAMESEDRLVRGNFGGEFIVKLQG